MGQGLTLKGNDSVAIIGAGPAGSLFAYCLLRLAKREKLHLQVSLYNDRDFTVAGPAGCNKCAGVINGSLWQRLQRIGINPEQTPGLIRSTLRGYLWSTPRGCLRMDVPKGWEPARTVFRGGGPSFTGNSEECLIYGFDKFLLRYAIEAGAQYHTGQVVDVEMPLRQCDPVKLTIRDKQHQWQTDAELVVGAFGLGRQLTQKFSELVTGYQPPVCTHAAQVELIRRPGSKRQFVDDYIQVHNISGLRVKQLVLTPKGDCATLTLLGAEDLGAGDFETVKNTDEMKSILASGWDWPGQACSCLPLMQQNCAKGFFADRLVMIGDAACSKYYKNGLESALCSAQMAANTAIYKGIDRESFRRWYWPKVRREIIRGNDYGRLLFSTHQYISSHPWMMNLFLQAYATMTRPAIIQQHDAILWDMLSGNRPYLHIFNRIIDPEWSMPMALQLLKVLTLQFNTKIKDKGREIYCNVNKYLDGFAKKHATKKPNTRVIAKPRTVLWNNARISIIGGGPAGTSCAITLMQLARKQNIQLKVTIHEAKDFAGAAAMHHPSNSPSDDKRVNQCVGVLSPPIFEIVTEKLHIPFPNHLVQKYITGYILHGQRQSIALDEIYGASYALRRITFDDYMMHHAVKHDVHWDMTKVLQLQPRGNGFEITTSRGSVFADVVVGAFGVDQEMADVFEICFGYRRPQYLETVIVKQHPSEEFMRQFGLNIHAFLPALPAVEFGAITPKYNHLTINIAGRCVDRGAMEDFLKLPRVSQLLPDDYDEKNHPDGTVYYPGRFPTSPAGNFFADHMVVIGDASGMLRPFKGKGVNAAILSGVAAANIMVHRGLTKKDFQRYYLPIFHQVTDDIWYGRLVRFMTNTLANRGGMDVILALAEEIPILRRALAESVSGAASYREIFHRFTDQLVLRQAGASLLRQIMTKNQSTQELHSD